jgi:hypothetical protein
LILNRELYDALAFLTKASILYRNGLGVLSDLQAAEKKATEMLKLGHQQYLDGGVDTVPKTTPMVDRATAEKYFANRKVAAPETVVLPKPTKSVCDKPVVKSRPGVDAGATKERNDKVRALWAERLRPGVRRGKLIDEMAVEFNVAPVTITRIINRYGSYKYV